MLWWIMLYLSADCIFGLISEIVYVLTIDNQENFHIKVITILLGSNESPRKLSVV